MFVYFALQFPPNIAKPYAGRKISFYHQYYIDYDENNGANTLNSDWRFWMGGFITIADIINTMLTRNSVLILSQTKVIQKCPG